MAGLDSIALLLWTQLLPDYYPQFQRRVRGGAGIEVDSSHVRTEWFCVSPSACHRRRQEWYYILIEHQCIDWIKCDSPLIWLINDSLNRSRLRVLVQNHSCVWHTMLMGTWVLAEWKLSSPINVINLSCECHWPPLFTINRNITSSIHPRRRGPGTSCQGRRFPICVIFCIKSSSVN